MQSIFFANNSNDEKVSIFDDNLENCTCLACGKPLIPYRGNKRAWHFQHASNCKCSRSERLSLTNLARLALCELDTLVLPEVFYVFNGKKYILSKSTVFHISSFSVEKTSAGSVLVVTDKSDEKVYIEISIRCKCSLTTIQNYRKENSTAFELQFRESDFDGCTSMTELRNRFLGKLINRDYCYSWLSHPIGNSIFNLVERSGIHYSNSNGLGIVYCPRDAKTVNVSDCKGCNVMTHLTLKALYCRGDLSRKELSLISPDFVAPPSIERNYVGACDSCGSNNTVYEDNGVSMYKKCNSCGKTTPVKCPICSSNLELKTNRKIRYKSYGSVFIGCKSCAFTLTYLNSENKSDFADEICITGGLDGINKSTYTELLRYRDSRKHYNK